MALFSTTSHLPCKALLHAIIFILLAILSKSNESSCFESIISLVDSLTDTGNLLLLSTPPMLPDSAFRPYGRTFFQHPTGRSSDGRHIIDFVPKSLGLPLVQPYFATYSVKNYEKGVNFAVAGATALDVPYNPLTNVTLGVEIEWFMRFLASIPDGRRFLEKSLVLAGSIGGNDYNFRLWYNISSPAEAKSLVPPVVSFIGSTIRELIKLGARTILVPGIMPNGCSSAYLTIFRSSNEQDYEAKTKCLIWPNELAKYHIQLLKEELQVIQELYPKVTVSYADYYNDALRFYLYPSEFGYTDTLRACCGVGEPYNFSPTVRCGVQVVKSCDKPSRFVSWDGIHLTEATYRQMAQGLIEGSFINPPIRFICNSVSSSHKPLTV